MKISAVISEFNPFHSGHKYLIDETRANGATHVVAVMSGNFVQRGECAVFSKWDRARCALANGVDLVVENPLIYATASAQRFAYGGVGVIKGLGCVNELSFGSECGDFKKLKTLAEFIKKDDFAEALQKYLSQGMSFPAARQKAVEMKYTTEYAEILSNPNNILACEYISECLKADLNLDYFTVKRMGAEHDSKSSSNGFYSASNLRSLLKIGEVTSDAVFENVRKNCKVFDFTKLETSILVKLRSFTANDFLKIPDVSEGMENRLYSAAQKAVSLDDFYEQVKTKRYTHSRIRRIALVSFLGITKDDLDLHVPYVRVIGFNEKGREILKIAKNTSALPIVMKYSDIKNLDVNARRVFEIESRATDIFMLACDEKGACGAEMTQNIVIGED